MPECEYLGTKICTAQNPYSLVCTKFGGMNERGVRERCYQIAQEKEKMSPVHKRVDGLLKFIKEWLKDR